eukprot:scaffold16546_cov94-Skeletonema_dohrnii-CCMP3373.AAC.1
MERRQTAQKEKVLQQPDDKSSCAATPTNSNYRPYVKGLWWAVDSDQLHTYCVMYSPNCGKTKQKKNCPSADASSLPAQL